MKKICPIIVAVFLSVFMLSGVAGTLIESNDKTGKHVSIQISDEMARIDSSDLEGYMLINMAQEEIYAVSDDEHLIIDLSTPSDSNAIPDHTKSDKLNRLKATFINQGKGPDIAGYPTIHYKVMMGDTHCFDEYLAKELIDNHEIHRFIEVMATQSQSRENEGMVEYFAADNPCESADEIMDAQYLTLGVPLRTLDDHGVSIHEVIRIQNDATISAATFKIPGEYKIITKAELMRRTIKHIQADHSGVMQGDNPHSRTNDDVPHKKK